MASIPQSPGVKKAGRRGNAKLKAVKPTVVQLGPNYVAKSASLGKKSKVRRVT
jgi:hypothetical protein